jgi:hypothetical protein
MHAHAADALQKQGGCRTAAHREIGSAATVVPLCADASADAAAGRAKRGTERQQVFGDYLAGSSPASSDARRATASSPGAAEGATSPAALVFEYDPEYIERKCGPSLVIFLRIK